MPHDPAPPPTTRTLNWLSLVTERDPDREKPDPAYQFSNGRKFESTDHAETGIYRRD